MKPVALLPRASVRTWDIQDISVVVTRRKMKHLRITVHPPDGQVKVSAPRYVSNAEIQEFICERLDWVKQQREYFLRQPRRPEPKLLSGETIILWGEALRLELVTDGAEILKGLNFGRSKVLVSGNTLYLRTQQDADLQKKQNSLDGFYRKIIKQKIPDYIEQWQPKLGVSVQDWGVKKMRTRWGSCNIGEARIWLNLELVHYPMVCLEYVVVHELVHLLEANHSARFWALLDEHFPAWRGASDRLKSGSRVM